MREKFLFVDLRGLDVAKLPAGTTRFELELVLTTAYPSDQHFSRENARLLCSPVINLFELGAEPIEINHHETEYRVVAAGHQGEHADSKYVAIVAFYRNPGMGNGWKYVVERKKLDADKPLKLEMVDQLLLADGESSR